MNPRHRRLLIPGLLVALLVVVVVASLFGRSDAATEGPQVVLSDPRITESSGLAVSTSEPGLAYTVNDSGNDAVLFAVDLATGRTVGETHLEASLRDVEALALVDGTLWIADIGDNLAVRDDIALYAIDEPGRRSATVTPTRYPIALPGGPADAEALVADPASGHLFLVTKSLASGVVLEVPELRTDRVTELREVARDMPTVVTDGAFSPDGSRVVLINYGWLWTLDPQDWSLVGVQSLPPLAQAETVSFVTGDAVLVGSEGEDSPLLRITVDPSNGSSPTLETVATSPTAAVADTATASAVSEDQDSASRPVVLVVAVLVTAGALVALGLRLRAR